MSEKLMARWRSLAGSGADPLGSELITRYGEPHRRYHTTAHLEAVLTHIDALADHAEHPDLVRLAAWFHDAVYDPRRGDNEERSAGLAERALPEMGLPAEAVATVARLVRLTVTHAPAPGDADGAVLSDADLAILGASPEVYARYAAAVREEYGFVPDDAFRAGRAAVLRSLLDLPVIFHVAGLEEAARANIAAELERL
ncbi:metal-dependent phosphohydrolase [Streptosporangium sp. NPDC048865]|uniref:HD domain-containing protein n=1 Tax=Streptosporangium sp. NPDC048865 TaxID=3155766 RepID=UPI00343254FD